MRIVFMGTPKFAASILSDIAPHHDVVCVYTRPDKVRGRGKKLEPSDVKIEAENLGIEVRTPKSLRDAAEVDGLAALDPDAICVAAYGMILPKDVLEIPKLGCLNVHASLLPRWRGAAPIEHAIIEGDDYAGVCIMQMEEGLDTGDWCVCRKIPIAGMRASQVEDELAALGSQALLSALEQVEQQNAFWTKQDSAHVTYAEKIGKKDLWLDPDGEVLREFRKFLASGDSHTCKANIAGRTCTICDAALVEKGSDNSNRLPGVSMVSTEGKRLLLGFKDGAIDVLSLKPDGKSQMDARAYLAGARIEEGSKWSAA